jgi:uncharacterized protein
MQMGHDIFHPGGTARVSAFCAFAVMTKAPQVGAVKTRLVPPLSQNQAVVLNTCFLRDTGLVIAQACIPGEIDGFAAYTPVGTETAFDGLLPPDFRLLPQRGADLGERLFHAAEDFFTAGYRAVCLINSDSPTLPAALIQKAVELLRPSGDRVVLGPAEDGGYYLIGLKRAHQHLFEDIVWSTETVLASTLERAHEIGLEAMLLPAWYDVDDAASLRRLCQELFSNNAESGSQPGYAAPHTREYLSHLIKIGQATWAGLKLTADAGGT